MAFEDLKEQLSSSLKSFGERVQESPAYQSLKDRYDTLSPSGQRFVLTAFAALLAFLLLAYPLESYFQSVETVEAYEGKRDLIRAMFKAKQDEQNAIPLPAPPPLDFMRSQIEDRLKGELKLQPEQIANVSQSGEKTTLAKEDAIEGSLQVNLLKLNLRQVVDVGHMIQSISPSVKLVDLSIDANKEMAGYFNVIYKVVSLKIPSLSPPPPPPPTDSGKAKVRKGPKQVEDK